MMERLDQLLPVPAAPRTVIVDWPSITAAIRTPLPDDYIDFIGRYGNGKVDDFLWVLSPATDNENLDLVRRGEGIRRALREYRTTLTNLGKTLPFSVFPEPGGLLPWGVTENGDVCFWRTGNPDPNAWMVVINDGRGSMWEQFAGSMTEFLRELLSRQFESEILTDDEFPSEAPSFEPR